MKSEFIFERTLRPPATRSSRSIIGQGLLGAVLAITAPCARAFSLLGPYARWMKQRDSGSRVEISVDR